MDDMILMPYRIYDQPDIAIYYKPQFWNVDVGTSIKYDLASVNMNDLTKDIRKNKPSIQLFIGKELEKEGIRFDKDDRNYGLCNRLDQSTSGLLFIGKGEENFKLGREVINDKKTTVKIYLCLCNGNLQTRSGMITKRINCRQIHTPGKKDYKYCENSNSEGVSAFSFYDKVASFRDKDGNEYSLVQVRIYTGRTHQIRIHMKSLGHPLVSDERYLDKEIYYRNKEICSRIFLHNFYLKFNWKQTPNTIKNILPVDLLACLARLEMTELYKRDFYELSEEIQRPLDVPVEENSKYQHRSNNNRKPANNKPANNKPSNNNKPANNKPSNNKQNSNKNQNRNNKPSNNNKRNNNI